MAVQAPIKLNADLTVPAFVDASKLTWVPSPAAGVERLLLERDGGEVARVTSVVRYAPNSSFPQHTHTGETSNHVQCPDSLLLPGETHKSH